MQAFQGGLARGQGVGGGFRLLFRLVQGIAGVQVLVHQGAAALQVQGRVVVVGLRGGHLGLRLADLQGVRGLHAGKLGLGLAQGGLCLVLLGTLLAVVDLGDDLPGLHSVAHLDVHGADDAGEPGAGLHDGAHLGLDDARGVQHLAHGGPADGGGLGDFGAAFSPRQEVSGNQGHGEGNGEADDDLLAHGVPVSVKYGEVWEIWAVWAMGRGGPLGERGVGAALTVRPRAWVRGAGQCRDYKYSCGEGEGHAPGGTARIVRFVPSVGGADRKTARCGRCPSIAAA
ncbi:hypothetical protein DSECCO2_648140 [anaerobic digester metagenome]